MTLLSAQGSGQPLGYLASWPLFTLSHRWCADKIYPGKRFYKYAILGDEICIADSKVAEVYLSTLKDLGVTI